MDIIDKLEKSNSRTSIYFFKQGIFAQLYGMSLYLARIELNLLVKVCGVRHKKCGGDLILRGGLPVSTLEKHFGRRLIHHDYGYEIRLTHEIEDLTDYNSWYLKQKNYLLKKEAIERNNKTELVEAEKNLEVSALSRELAASRQLTLSEQEYYFLMNWRQDKYPSSIESGFIRGLKEKILSQGRSRLR